MICQRILVVIPCQENRLFIQRAMEEDATKPICYESRRICVARMNVSSKTACSSVEKATVNNSAGRSSIPVFYTDSE